MKTYLISLTSEVDGVKSNYLDSIHKLGDSVEPIMVAFEPQPPQVSFRVIPVGCSYPNNLQRFKYFPMIFDDDDMIIFTDTSDVIFQCPIPKLENIIHVSCEYDTWGAPNWWKNWLDIYKFNELDTFPIYCMGTWAMPFSEVKDLLKFISENENRFGKANFADQILFNWWLKDKSFENNTDLFGTLYAGYLQKKIIKTNRGFVNSHDDLISIVHANGGLDLKELIKQHA